MSLRMTTALAPCDWDILMALEHTHGVSNHFAAIPNGLDPRFLAVTALVCGDGCGVPFLFSMALLCLLSVNWLVYRYGCSFFLL